MFSGFDTIPECDSQPATQPPSHVAVAITLNALAKASSLKIGQILAKLLARVGCPGVLFFTHKVYTPS